MSSVRRPWSMRKRSFLFLLLFHDSSISAVVFSSSADTSDGWATVCVWWQLGGLVTERPDSDLVHFSFIFYFTSFSQSYTVLGLSSKGLTFMGLPWASLYATHQPRQVSKESITLGIVHKVVNKGRRFSARVGWQGDTETKIKTKKLHLCQCYKGKKLTP